MFLYRALTTRPTAGWEAKNRLMMLEMRLRRFSFQPTSVLLVQEGRRVEKEERMIVQPFEAICPQMEIYYWGGG